MAATGDDHVYWDEVAVQEDRLPGGWRRHARSEHLRLLHGWIGPPQGTWLKTDLYEERHDDRALLPHLRSATWVGIDVSPEVARRSGAARTTATDVRRLPFARGTFDGVLSTSTLDHFDDVAQIHVSLVELRRVLRPGGHLVLTLDNPRNPLIRLRNGLPRSVAVRTGLVPFAVGATLDEPRGRDALASAGFRVEASEHLLHAPHVLATRPAAWPWWERHVLPRTVALGRTRAAPWSGHYVAFHAVAAEH